MVNNTFFPFFSEKKNDEKSEIPKNKIDAHLVLKHISDT